MAGATRKALTFRSLIAKQKNEAREAALAAARDLPPDTFYSNKEIRKILSNYARNERQEEYANLATTVHDSRLSEEQMRDLLDAATHRIPLLTSSLKLFVEAMLSIKWLDYGSKSIRRSYQKFVINLLSAHNIHIRFAFERLIDTFLINGPEWPNGIPQPEDCERCEEVHFIIRNLLTLVPMCRNNLIASIISHYPYYKIAAHVQELYVYNILSILDYAPELRINVLNLLIGKLITLDLNAPVEEIMKAKIAVGVDEIFPMEGDVEMKDAQVIQEKEQKTQHPTAYRLDVSMQQLFDYVMHSTHNAETGELNWTNTKAFYNDLVTVFDKILLPTYNTHHVQYVMFLLCSFKAVLAENFLNFLWKKACSPNFGHSYRHNAMIYIASLLVRGSYISISLLKDMLLEMSNWIHSYISTHDSSKLNLRAHISFYSVCQALFYVIAFRHLDLVSTSKNISFMESLNLTKIVTCYLNPLRICHQDIVQNFASVTRTYQLAYCYTIIERNSREVAQALYINEEMGTVEIRDSLLNSFFPFDPYYLKMSGRRIEPIYLNYKGCDDVSSLLAPKNIEDVEMDDFLMYSSSPGVKQKL